VTSGMIGMRRCLECGCKVQMSPDVVLECQECGRGSADSCMTTGKPLYHYSRFLPRDAIRRARLCYSMSSVCLSLCPSIRLSVAFRYRDPTVGILRKLFQPFSGPINLRLMLGLTPIWALWHATGKSQN